MSEAIRVQLMDLAPTEAFLSFPNPADEAHVRALAGRSEALEVRLAPPEEDTEGHASAWSGSDVWVRLLDDDDTEGHAVTLRFPTTADADAFRRRMLAGGLVAGAIILGGTGLAMSGAVGTGADSAPAVAPAPNVGTDSAAGRPDRSGVQQYAETGPGVVSGGASVAGQGGAGIDEDTGRPARSGPQR